MRLDKLLRILFVGSITLWCACYVAPSDTANDYETRPAQIGVSIANLDDRALNQYYDVPVIEGRSETIAEAERNQLVNGQDPPEVKNYPNPFAPTTDIRFNVVEPDSVRIRLYNAERNLVAELYRGRLNAGRYRLTLHPASGFASGVYFYRLDVGDSHRIKKIVILK